MTVSTSLIDAMLAAGATAEVIAAAWKAEIAALEAERENRRTKGRDRQRAHRASRDVTQCDGDNAIVTAGNDKKKSPQTPKEKQPPLNGSPKGEPIPPAKPKKGRSFEIDVPDDIPAEPWSAFAEMRKRKGKPLDDYTAKQLFGRLRTIRDAGWNIEDVINKAAIGNHDGFWMPDGRDSNVRRAKGQNGSSAKPMNAEELRAAIAWSEDHDDPEKAAEYRRQLIALKAKPPDPAVAAIVARTAQVLQHH